MSDAAAEGATLRLSAVRERIAGACEGCGRMPDEVTLVGASKRQPIDRIVQAVLAGVSHLGENYVQELSTKRPQVEERLPPDALARLRWHLVGGLQRNKVKTVIPLVESIDTVDRESLAVELDRRCAASGKILPVSIQVNLSAEPQKNGCAPEALGELLAACAPLDHLRVEGLMTVPAASDDPEASRANFARLRELRDTLRAAPGGGDLRELSMGMSGDLEVAIAEGATRVRVGTALFGPRET